MERILIQIPGVVANSTRANADKKAGSRGVEMVTALKNGEILSVLLSAAPVAIFFALPNLIN